MPECRLDGKPITSGITGDLCTSCYFASRKPVEVPKPIEEDKPIVLGKKTEEPTDDNPEHKPSLQKVTTPPNDGKKYCQSCIERYGNLVLATREWTKDYFICDDCLQPLVQQAMDYDVTRAEMAVKELKPKTQLNSPFLKQAYELLQVPEHLQYARTDQVLANRNDIFNYHAPMVANMSVEQITDKIETLSVLLFQIKIGIEPLQAYIDKVKYEERAKAALLGLEKSEKEFTKGTRSTVGKSKDEKMAKSLGMSVEQYRLMAEQARKTEFKKLTGS